MKPAVFLDRDGTLIEHVHHLCDPRQVRLIPGAGRALSRLRRAGFACVLVTNQSVIGRGRLTPNGLQGIHEVMRNQLLEEGGELDAIYFCPLAPAVSDPARIEHPDRKPGPGMLWRACREHGLEMSASWMAGDSISDMLAGRNAGCRATVLVRTGQGDSVNSGHSAVDYVVNDIAAAAQLIVNLATGEASARPDCAPPA